MKMKRPNVGTWLEPMDDDPSRYTVIQIHGKRPSRVPKMNGV